MAWAAEPQAWERRRVRQPLRSPRQAPLVLALCVAQTASLVGLQALPGQPRQRPPDVQQRFLPGPTAWQQLLQ